MQKEKKQFSLTLLMRVLLALLVVVSIGVFANSVMRYNQLKDEEHRLSAMLTDLNLEIERLNDLLDSAEQVEELLQNYSEYQEMLMETDPELAATIEEIHAKKAEIDAMLASSDNREYIEKIAHQQCNLFYPDEEIIYNDRND